MYVICNVLYNCIIISIYTYMLLMYSSGAYTHPKKNSLCFFLLPSSCHTDPGHGFRKSWDIFLARAHCTTNPNNGTTLWGKSFQNHQQHVWIKFWSPQNGSHFMNRSNVTQGGNFFSRRISWSLGSKKGPTLQVLNNSAQLPAELKLRTFKDLNTFENPHRIHRTGISTYI